MKTLVSVCVILTLASTAFADFRSGVEAYQRGNDVTALHEFIRGRERTHWIVDGPLGVPVSWDAITTGIVPNEEIAWKTEEGAAVAHAGVIRLVRVDDATRVELRMSYNPPAGVLGHAVAASFGRDPKRQLDDDLARLKTTIETGHAPRDAARQPAGTPATED